MMETTRINDIYRPAAERRCDFDPVERGLTGGEVRQQARRCGNCGIPFCHGTGCPLGNAIPDLNRAVAEGDWRTAWELLRSTSPFPEFTARVCPALCEGACTAGIDGEAVMVRQVEKAVVETAFANGWARPLLPRRDSGRSVAVIGSGPAGLAAAWRLAGLGHAVTVFEKDARPGGLLRYGIPDFKLEKTVIDRRVDLMRRSGIHFECDTAVGEDVSGAYLERHFDAVAAAVGTPAARDLEVPGRDLEGIHFALEFLRGQNRAVSGECRGVPISARGKNVLVVGGGDTGSDCVGTALRQGAASVTQIELLPQPPERRSPATPWPQWPHLLRTSSSHREGGVRRWSLATKAFHGRNGRVCEVETAALDWRGRDFSERPGGTERIPADLVFLAMGFLKTPVELGLSADAFLCGDAANGATLVVRAIADGLAAADRIEEALS